MSISFECDITKFVEFEFNLETMCKTPNILIIGHSTDKMILGLKTNPNTHDIYNNIINHIIDYVKSNHTNYKFTTITSKKRTKYYEETIDAQNNMYQLHDFAKLKYIVATQQKKEIRPKYYHVVITDVTYPLKQCIQQAEYYEIIFNGRLYSVMNILKSTEPLYLPPDVRCNLDYVFLFFIDDLSYLKEIYLYAGMFPSFSLFEQVFRRFASDGYGIAIRIRGRHIDIYDGVYKFKINIVINQNIKKTQCANPIDTLFDETLNQMILKQKTNHNKMTICFCDLTD